MIMNGFEWAPAGPDFRFKTIIIHEASFHLRQYRESLPITSQAITLKTGISTIVTIYLIQ